MVPGSSIFIPALNLQEAVNQVYYIAKQRGWSFDHRVRIEGALSGVRFWRIS
jgi:hypothetical protein